MVTVRDFTPSDSAAFAALNLRWIEQLFVLEDHDREQLLDPQTSIVDAGGVIAIADFEGAVVGCGALVHPSNPPPDGKAWLELAKMATDPACQRMGAGLAIIMFLVEKARAVGCDAIWLETNAALAPAIRLYERAGFRILADSEHWPTAYARSDFQMVLEIAPSSADHGRLEQRGSI